MLFPVVGSRLVRQDVANHAARADKFHRERIAFVISRCRHRQADHKTSAHVERFRRKHQEWVNILHFAPNLGAAFDPNNIPPIWRPQSTRTH